MSLPDDRLGRAGLFESVYGPIAEPPDMEEQAEGHAYLRFCEPLRHVPRDWRSQGMGQG
jgi:hypothetical protein